MAFLEPFLAKQYKAKISSANLLPSCALIISESIEISPTKFMQYISKKFLGILSSIRGVKSSIYII